MTFKNLSYTLFIVLLLNGCSYKLVNTEKLDAIDAKLSKLEDNLSQSISKDLDTKLNKQDEKVQSLFEESRIEQDEKIQSLSNELTALIKAKNTPKTRVKKSRKAPRKVNQALTTHKEKLVVGRVEKVHVYPSDLVMNARIDTGAETSSIHANDIVRFERDGAKWVRFTLVNEKTNKPHTIERKITRDVKIIQSSLDEGYERRAVVTLKITIGDKKELSEFTLTSREHMTYAILIGRNVLQDLIVVDVSEKYIAPLVVEKEEKFKK